MGNRHAVEEKIKEKMGADTKVVHKVAYPVTMVSAINGKKGKRECAPMYYNCPAAISRSMCGSALEKTADNAAAIAASGAPPTVVMLR